MISSQCDNTFRAYFTDSVESAMMLAKSELGDDAVLLGSRRTRPDEGATGQYEVRFQTGGEALTERPEANPSDSRVAREISALRRQIDSIHQTIAKSLLGPPRWQASSPELTELLSSLVAADIDGAIAQEAVEAAHAAGATDRRSALECVRDELIRRLPAERAQSATGPGRRVIALVGPPGAGKTTTLIKLAIQYGLTARRSMQLISTDDYRVGSTEQFRSYASILGVGCQICGTSAGLSQALDEHRAKDLILIDTPGLAAREVDTNSDLGRFLARRAEIETHLVLMSSMRTADLFRVWEAFRWYQVDRLIFTRADETGALGGVYTLASRCGTPISFIGTGQRIPEDLERAEPERIVDRILLTDPSRRTSLAA